MTHAVQPERDRDLTRDHAADTDGDGVRCDVPAAVDEEILILPLADVDAAAAAADEDPGICFTGAKPRVLPGLARGQHTVERGARIVPRIGASVLFAIAVERRRLIDRNGRNPRSDAAGICGDVELCDCLGGARPAAHVVPETLAPEAER